MAGARQPITPFMRLQVPTMSFIYTPHGSNRKLKETKGKNDELGSPLLHFIPPLPRIFISLKESLVPRYLIVRQSCIVITCSSSRWRDPG